MTALLALAVGLIGGALLPRAVYRRSVASETPDRTECHHCGHTIRGWLHCAHCGQRWGQPWWVLAGVAGAASAVVALSIGPEPVLPLLVALVLLGTALGAIDIACQRLPTALVAPAIVVGAGLLLGLAALTGAWGAFGRALLGAAALGLVYLLLFLVPGQNLGYGDVRLAVLLGLFLGWLGWSQVVWGVLLPWLVNGPVVLVLLLLGRVDRKTRLPFGPAMLVGALLAVVVPVAVPAILDF